LIKFANGVSNEYLMLTQLDNYLQLISDQNNGYVILGQKGNRKLNPER